MPAARSIWCHCGLCYIRMTPNQTKKKHAPFASFPPMLLFYSSSDAWPIFVRRFGGTFSKTKKLLNDTNLTPSPTVSQWMPRTPKASLSIRH